MGDNELSIDRDQYKGNTSKKKPNTNLVSNGLVVWPEVMGLQHDPLSHVIYSYGLHKTVID